MIKKKNQAKNIISVIIVVATVVFAIYFLRKNFSFIVYNIKNNTVYLIFIALAYILGRIIDGLRLKVLSAAFELKLKPNEWIGLSFIVPYYNLILPKGGTIANAAYFNIKHNFKIEQFASFASGGLILTFLVNSLFGIIAVFISTLAEKRLSNLWFLAVFIPFLIVALTFFLLKPLNFFRRNKLLAKINIFLEGIKKLSSRKDIISKLLLLQIALLSTFTLRYYFAFRLLDLDVSYWSVLSLSSVTYISNILNIAPANLGLREVVISLGTHFIGKGIQNGALVSIVDRSTNTIITCAFGIYYHIKLMGSISERRKERIAARVISSND